MIWIPCCNGFCGVPLFRQACDGWIGRHPCCATRTTVDGGGWPENVVRLLSVRQGKDESPISKCNCMYILVGKKQTPGLASGW
ncbi:hypothetical protein HanXRQr2_Chr16g0769061 [Helianthus annuus]|uniref:Uncharacterized protein n=1 Tax=Helianthus annuus TaxID=4232 RepID=A0A9K3DW17_HELAN|nr:hypothetical protein HanXRQr2_Chr16g0769061 [Helianthus annuus]